MEPVAKPPMINRTRLVETFLELVRIDSPSQQEAAIADYLEPTLSACGCTVMRQPYGASFNLIATRPSPLPNAPWLLLSAHMDTVESTAGIDCRIEDGIIRSAGTTILGADDKSALAQIVEMLRIMQEYLLPAINLEIVLTSGEEQGLMGARNLNMSRLKSRRAVVLDISGPPGLIVTAAPAREQFSIAVLGRAAHAGIEPEKGINAVRVAAEIIAELPNARIDDRTTFNVSMLTGGAAMNIVPKEATICGEFRTHDDDLRRELRARIQAVAEGIAGRHGAAVNIQMEPEYEGFRLDDNEPFLVHIEAAITACGVTPQRITTGGGSDANIFNTCGIVCVNISNGMMQIHSPEEHISVDNLVAGTEILIRLVCAR